jgi:uncharacterized UBP type Zn finger protein
VTACAHLDRISSDLTPSATEGCTDCLAIGSTNWVHLRQCLSCGYVACCDSSPYGHATAHFRDSGHPVMRSFQPGENWRWCYVDEAIV